MFDERFAKTMHIFLRSVVSRLSTLGTRRAKGKCNNTLEP